MSPFFLVFPLFWGVLTLCQGHTTSGLAWASRLAKATAERRVYLGSQFEGTVGHGGGVAAGAWHQEREKAGPPLSAGREAAVDAQLTFPFSFCPGSWPLGWCCPLSGWVFFAQLNLSGNTFRDLPGAVSPR